MSSASSTASPTTSPSTSAAAEASTFWTTPIIIAFSVCGFAVLMMLIMLNVILIRRRRRKEDQKRTVEESVLTAEKQRLETILQYITAANDRNAPKSMERSVWTFQPTPQAPVCPHGMSRSPYAAPGYQSAFVDICPTCCPHQALGAQGHLLPNVGTYMPAPMLQQPYGAGMAGGMGGGMAGDFFSQVRMRRARDPSEMPSSKLYSHLFMSAVAPPVPPPGFVAVPMVLERIST